MKHRSILATLCLLAGVFMLCICTASANTDSNGGGQPPASQPARDVEPANPPAIPAPTPGDPAGQPGEAKREEEAEGEKGPSETDPHAEPPAPEDPPAPGPGGNESGVNP